MKCRRPFLPFLRVIYKSTQDNFGQSNRKSEPKTHLYNNLSAVR